MKKNPLGRGLESLIPKTHIKDEKDEKLVEVDITDIIPNDKQPRRDFDPDALQALTSSIKERGVMQPLVAFRTDNNKFMLVAGERRLRAAGLAQVRKVPVIIIQKPSENERLELALIENTQRDDLKPLELADAYKELIAKCGYKQEEVAKIAGKSRSAVANTLRLLELPNVVKQALEDRKITEGHARVFLTLDKENIGTLLNAVLTRSLSVRQTEAMAKSLATVEKEKQPAKIDPNMKAILKQMESYIGSKIRMKTGKKENTGVIEIKYNSEEELDNIVNILRGE